MQIEAFYEKILGIQSPWFIEKIVVDSPKKHQISVYLDPKKSCLFVCPSCGELSPVHDHQRYRHWRHLDTCQYETYLYAKLPRVGCNQCGVKTIQAGWASGQSRFSEMFESHAIDVLQNIQVVSQSALQLRVSHDQLHYLLKKSVNRGLSLRKAAELPLKRLAIDEKSLEKGHKYVTILTDSVENKVLEVSENRTKESVESVYKSLTANQLAQIKSVTMDMWSPFAKVTQLMAPQADVVHDKFHLMAYLNNAVDITRRAETKKLSADNDTSLQKTKYLWLKNPNELPESKTDLLEAFLQRTELKTVQAYQLKEAFKAFYKSPTVSEASVFFKDWHQKVLDSKNASLIKVATMFQNHLNGILNIVKHQVSNAIAESINSRIQALKAKARGFKSASAFRIAILFHFGKLYLYP